MPSTRSMASSCQAVSGSRPSIDRVWSVRLPLTRATCVPAGNTRAYRSVPATGSVLVSIERDVSLTANLYRVTGSMEPEDDESGRPRRSAGRRWLWPVLGAAALTALLAGVAALTIGPSGRWASPRASAGPTQPRPSGPHTYRVEVCNPIPGDGDIMTCPSRSPYLPAGVTPE